MASWVIGYGIVKSVAPYFTEKKKGVFVGELSDFYSCSYRTSFVV